MLKQFKPLRADVQWLASFEVPTSLPAACFRHRPPAKFFREEPEAVHGECFFRKAK